MPTARRHRPGLLAIAFAVGFLLSPLFVTAAVTADFGLIPIPDGWFVSRGLTTIGTKLWATGTSGAAHQATIFEIDLPSGAVSEHPLGSSFGNDPTVLSIIGGPDGNPWFIGAQLGPGAMPVPQGGAFLGEVLTDGTLTMTALPADVFDNDLYQTMAFDPVSGVLVWGQASAPGPSFGIGYRTAQGQIGTVGLSAPGAPVSVTLGTDGNFYFVDASLDGLRIGKLSPAGALSFPAQVTFNSSNFCSSNPPGGTPSLVIAASDGNLYFSFPAEIDQMSASGAILSFPLPSCTTVDSLAEGQDGLIYFGSSSKNAVGRLTPATGAVDLFPLPSNYAPNLELLVPSPIALSGYDAVFASWLAGPGLLRLREAGSACPQVWERNLEPIRIETQRSFFEEVGVPPDKPIHITGNPFGIILQNHPQLFGIGGATAAPGNYTISVTVADPTFCPVDLVAIPVDVYAPPVRHVIPLHEQRPADVEPRP